MRASTAPAADASLTVESAPYVAPVVQFAKPHTARIRGVEPLAEISKSLGGISTELLSDLSERKVVTRVSNLGKKTR